jgi:hypothetical protein
VPSFCPPVGDPATEQLGQKGGRRWIDCSGLTFYSV